MLMMAIGFIASSGWADTTPLLKRGVNLGHWLQYWGRQPVVAADMIAIQTAGFDHVRIPFDPVRYLGWNPDATPPTVYWTGLDQAVDLALQANLEVILDFHPEIEIYRRMEQETSVQQAFVNLWGQISIHYANRPVSQVAFELLNEPGFWDADGAARWSALQQQALNRVRQAAPSHLVLLTGNQGGTIAGLVQMTAIDDPNVRYVFHYYEPMLFTHLNAPWNPFLTLPQGMITNLAYPAKNALNQVKLLPNAGKPAAMAAVNQYVSERWDAALVKQKISSASTWAKQQNVTLICTEFGVFRYGPDAKSRQAWLTDVRSALESLGIGWTIWDYTDMFAAAIPTNGKTTPASMPAIVPVDPQNPHRVFDKAILEALGLKK